MHLSTAPSRRTALLAGCALFWLHGAACAQQQDSPGLAFADLIGWWRADLTYNGQHSEMYLRFAEENGKPTVRVTLPDINGWDFPVGGAKVEGNRVELTSVAMPFTYDAPSRTLNGELPKDLAPAQKIAARFHRSAAPAIPPPDKWTGARPQIAWSVAIDGAVWAGLAHDEQNARILVPSDTGAVTALDVRDGGRAWVHRTGGKVRAQPMLHGGFVYVNSDDGSLYKLDARNGGEVWRAAIDSRTAPRPERAFFDRYGSAARVADGRVYVGSGDGSLYALDDASGRQLWRAQAKDKVYATPVLNGDTIVFGSFDGYLYAVAATDGSPRWQHDTRGAISTAPAIAGKHIIVGNRAFELTGRDARTGEERWRQYLFFSWIDSDLTAAGDTVYVGSSDWSSVQAFDVATGRMLWRTGLGGWCWAQPAVGKDRVYAGTSGGPGAVGPRRGALAALDRASGEVQWMHEVESTGKSWGFPSSPVLAGDRLYAADVTGRVYAFSR